MLGVMKATLTRDDDVATRLEQAHQRNGKSLERLGNDEQAWHCSRAAVAV